MPEIVVFLVSLTAIVFGADWLGNAAVHLSHRLYLPKVLVGATFISVATTLPEIVIAGFSGASGQPALGIGTVFGSPIANIGLILGILLLFSKVRLQDPHYVRTIQIFLAVLVIVFLVSITGNLTPLVGIVLIIFGILYLIIEFIVSKHEMGTVEKVESRFERFKDYFTDGNNYHQIFYLLTGSLLLFFGARFLIDSAAAITAIFGIPQIVIGLVIIAFGTSLPEGVTAINSIVRKRKELSAGNLFGASILNLTIALGVLSLFGNAEIDRPALFLTIGIVSILSIFSLVPVLGKVSPRILGVASIVIYVIFIVWFANIETTGVNLF